ncbi:unconventional prefoldin RPB5 interactor-like [Ylistrum balloti]|uniref:unconventional prefoldin RPB5 interactor-like n=1 Tax=Ylistrum balloti TaxID=509963 RepID=UPI002905A9F6|nr:unconventional prefoldin RPB5 interactor-like [Ylistrum balloti]
MSQRQFSRLKEEQEKAIQETNIKLEKWEQFKSDYVALKSRLKTLPDKVSHDVMVPFGSLAFMPGKLVHTNEVLVLLGDNWFVERSAKQAAAIVDRRLKDVESQLDGLKQQRKILSPRLEFTTDLTKSVEEQGVVDITEEYDEEKESLWREQHRKRVQDLKKKKQGPRKSSGFQDRSEGQEKPMTDEQLWERLDELERIEAEGNELQMLDMEDEIKLSLPPQSDDDEEEEDEEEDESSLSTSDDSEHEGSSRITFTHTKVDESEEKENSDKIESPRDIYRQFCETKPKSIMKPNTKDEQQKVRLKKKVKMKEDVTPEESRQKRGIAQGPVAFSGTVIEKKQDPLVKTFNARTSDKTVDHINKMRDETRQESVNVKDTTQPRRVSKFKAGRQRNTEPS